MGWLIRLAQKSPLSAGFYGADFAATLPSGNLEYINFYDLFSCSIEYINIFESAQGLATPHITNLFQN